MLKLNEGVRNLYKNTELSVAEAVACASINPARAVGEDKNIGSIEVGKLADIIICDDDFNVEKTFINGKEWKE